jgi:CelD/BcsL family acetyltransferase involved in cellulose biosynthesis
MEVATSASASGDMDGSVVELITDIETWSSQREYWQKIFDAGTAHTPYQQFDWLYNWWCTFGNDRLYIVRVNDSVGRVLGYAPMYIRSRYFGVPIKHLSYIADKRTDYLGFIVTPGGEDEFFQVLFTFLHSRRKDFSFIELRDMPATSPYLDALENAAARWFPHQYKKIDQTCVSVPLTKSWDEQLALLGKRMRRHVRYDPRNLARHAEVQFREYRHWDDFAGIYDQMADVYRQRWTDELGSTRYDDTASANFESSVLRAYAELGMLRVWVLFVDGKPVAWTDAYVLGGTAFIDTNVHSPEYHRYSVGNVLVGHVLQDCIEQGLTEFDLSRGVERYKYRWGGREKYNIRLLLASSRWQLLVARSIRKLYERVSQLRQH